MAYPEHERLFEAFRSRLPRRRRRDPLEVWYLWRIQEEVVELYGPSFGIDLDKYQEEKLLLLQAVDRLDPKVRRASARVVRASYSLL